MSNTITITRALAEIKSLDSKIAKSIGDARFIDIKKKSQTHINGVGIENVKSEIQGSYDKITQLIKNRDTLKRAVILSNATTRVTIGAEIMTVAEAIDKKNTINNQIDLLNEMSRQYSQLTTDITKRNLQIEQQAEQAANQNFGNKQKSNPTEYNQFVEDFKARNEYELIDPIILKKKIDELCEKINEFETEVDFVLSESNAGTKIEVNLA